MSNQNVDPWMLEFDFDATLTQMWNGRFEDRDGHFVVTDADWNARLKPGESFSFGFNGEYSGAFSEPTNYLVNRRPLNMPALISVAQRDPGVQLFVNAARGSGHSIGWETAISTPIDRQHVLLAPVGDLPSSLIVLIEDGEVVSSTLQWAQASGFPVCDPTTNTTLHLSWVDFVQIGYTLPYTASECKAHDKSDIYSVTIADSQSVPLDPVTARIEFNRDGTAKDNSLVGKPVGIHTLQNLVKVKPEKPYEPVGSSRVKELTNVLRETLGDKAAPYLATIPVSMGGTGPEIKGQYQTCSIGKEWSAQCGTGTTEKPGTGDPENPPNPNPKDPPGSGDTGEDDTGSGDTGADGGGSTDGDSTDTGTDGGEDTGGRDDTGGGSGGGSGGSNGGGSSSGNDTPSGPRYDEEEYRSLQGEVKTWEGVVAGEEEFLQGLKGRRYLQELEQTKLYDKLDELNEGTIPLIRDVADELEDLEQDVKNVNSDLRGDAVGIVGGGAGTMYGCATAVGRADKASCKAGIGLGIVSVASYAGHYKESKGYEAELEGLKARLEANSYRVEDTARKAGKVDERIKDLDGKIEDSENRLSGFKETLGQKRSNVSEFEKKYGIK